MVDALPPAYTATETNPMWCMTVTAAAFRPAAAAGDVVALNASHADAVATLFADAREGGDPASGTVVGETTWRTGPRLNGVGPAMPDGF
jgi:hypothetical protein